jgi:hypothetical protein
MITLFIFEHNNVGLNDPIRRQRYEKIPKSEAMTTKKLKIAP